MPPRILAFAASLLTAAFSTGAEPAAQEDRWTRFGRAVCALHERQLDGREVRAHESSGSYRGVAAAGYGWREVRYLDAASGRLLSVVTYDRDRPGVVHLVETYIYDDRGRVVRDYAVVYLPWRTHRPVLTLVNLHAYNGELHAFRQFDALGKHLRDQCEGVFRGRPVSYSLDEIDLYEGPPATAAYRACVAGLPAEAGDFLNPH